MNRILLAILLPLGQIALAVVTFFIVLFGQSEVRVEIERGMSRTLSALTDGQGDCTASCWAYRMVVHEKKWGPERVSFIDWINRSPGHCQRAYEWHKLHGLVDADPNLFPDVGQG